MHGAYVVGQEFSKIFSIRDKIVNILGSVGRMVSVANTEPCHYSANVVTLKRYVNIWLVAYILPIPFLTLILQAERETVVSLGEKKELG